MWRAYDIGGGKFYSADQLAQFETPQGPTRLVTASGNLQQPKRRSRYLSVSCTDVLNLGHHKNYLIRHREKKKARYFLVERKGVSRCFSGSLPSKSTLTSANTR